MAASSSAFIFSIVLICGSIFLVHNNNVAVASADYGAALTKSLLFLEGQRSGMLPRDQRVKWRGNSGLNDGRDAGVDLVGGYYDAGDNLKLGFPMAFTITMLSWSTIEFRDKLEKQNELSNALKAIKWGTDYFMKAHPHPDILYGQVGDPDSDHECWQRPEDMTTSRNAYKIDEKNPGSDLAGETAAALAAASIVFRPVDRKYASRLRAHAVQLFDLASNHQGVYHNSIPTAQKVYSSSGYKDELLWAAVWLHRATRMKKYLDYLGGSGDNGGVRSEFSWDDKYVGVQLLVTKLIMDGEVENSEIWAQYSANAADFICASAKKVKKTGGGLLWFQPWNNNQYVSTAAFVMSVYSHYLSAPTHPQGGVRITDGILCDFVDRFHPSDLTSVVRSQVDYILGANPKKMSYMVGYGSNYPQQIHHRGASVKSDSAPVTCKGGFDAWFNKNSPNPNVLEGAVVSPDYNDNYQDVRSNYQQAEPTTVTNAPLVGVLAFLA